MTARRLKELHTDTNKRTPQIFPDSSAYFEEISAPETILPKILRFVLTGKSFTLVPINVPPKSLPIRLSPLRETFQPSDSARPWSFQKESGPALGYSDSVCTRRAAKVEERPDPNKGHDGSECRTKKDEADPHQEAGAIFSGQPLKGTRHRTKAPP
ncbi:hypothetical protein KM043_007940 [Ampulex compressa]|nr:hypothetical protein KM043_007940 [Ampulex compressa]